MENPVTKAWLAPQGSVLGLLLFLVSINDLEEGIRSSIKYFADDASLFHFMSTLYVPVWVMYVPMSALYVPVWVMHAHMWTSPIQKNLP